MDDEPKTAAEIIEGIATLFGIPYAKLAADYQRMHAGGVLKTAPKVLDREYVIPIATYRKRYFPLTVIAYLGYNPNRLLENKRDN